jgi:1,4-alpha-glucan branching enzyme
VELPLDQTFPQKQCKTAFENNEYRQDVMTSMMKKKETFSLVAPEASRVLLAGDFTGWEENPVGLKKQKDGTWKATITLEAGPHEYRFIVDGQWRDDDQCGLRRSNPFGATNCVREVQP